MDNTENEQLLKDFGKRAQRCYGCFVAYHLRDMYLGEDATFFCEHCKDDTMFHYSDFSKMMDIRSLRKRTTTITIIKHSSCGSLFT